MLALLNQYATMSNRNYNDRIRREQNIFNKYEAQRAREWNQQMDSTKYQRTVADMQSAGINPALAMQGGVTTQATSNATASAANVGTPELDLSQVAQMVMQERQLKIQEKLADSQARKNNAEAENKEIENKYADEFNTLRNEGIKISNSLSDAQISQIGKNIEKMDEEIAKIKKEAATEEERRLLTIAETSLKQAMMDKTEAERKQIVELLPYQKALMSAQSANQRAQASYALVQAAYQQGLIDNGYIESLVRATNNKADETEVRKIAGQIENNLKTGNWFTGKDVGSRVANTMLGAASALDKVIGAICPIKFSRSTSVIE